MSTNKIKSFSCKVSVYFSILQESQTNLDGTVECEDIFVCVSVFQIQINGKTFEIQISI
jgi:hypothetical protein